MTLKPISMQSPPSLRTFNLENKKSIPSDTSLLTPNDRGVYQYELLDSSITVRQNEEFIIACTVENSRPAANIHFLMLNSLPENNSSGEDDLALQSLNINSANSYLTLSPSGGFSTRATTKNPSSSSVIESRSIVTSNSDKTFKTVLTARVKVSRNDHGKMIMCKAENGFSNQKWENKKLLNVLCKF